MHALDEASFKDLVDQERAANARDVSAMLSVTFVDYTGLPDHPDLQRARRYFPLGPGAVGGVRDQGWFGSG